MLPWHLMTWEFCCNDVEEVVELSCGEAVPVTVGAAGTERTLEAMARIAPANLMARCILEV